MSGTQRITYTQEWDAGYRLAVVTATVGGVTRFADDGDGARVQQVHASGITLYLGAVALTLSPTGRITRTYYFVNGQRIALREQRSDGMVVYFLHNDALGSAALVTGLTGTVVSSLRYTPYGLPRGETGRLPTPYRYTGQRDTGVGFYDYQARLYDPAVGRFAQADTLVPEAGKSQSLNRYMYGLGNPLKYIDPTGHFTDEALKAYLQGQYQDDWEQYWQVWQADEAWMALLHRAQGGDIFYRATTDRTGNPRLDYFKLVGSGQDTLSGVEQLMGAEWRWQDSQPCKLDAIYHDAYIQGIGGLHFGDKGEIENLGTVGNYFSVSISKVSALESRTKDVLVWAELSTIGFWAGNIPGAILGFLTAVLNRDISGLPGMMTNDIYLTVSFAGLPPQAGRLAPERVEFTYIFRNGENINRSLERYTIFMNNRPN